MAQRPLRCLITGANTGLGYEVARQLLLKGHDVILACRDATKAQAAAQHLQQHLAASKPRASSAAASQPHAAAASPESDKSEVSQQQQQQRQEPPARVTTVKCDLSSFESVRECAADVAARWPELDVLVCNAAVIPRAYRRTRDGINEQLQVNHLSHFLLVDQLLPCLLRSAEQRAAAAGAGTAAGTAAGAAAAAAGKGGAAAGTRADPSQQKIGGSNSSSGSSSRIVIVGSGQHAQVPPGFQDPTQLRVLLPGSTEECPLPPMQLYALTKLCNIWHCRHLAKHVLAGTRGKVVANVVTPGFIPATDLGRHLARNWLSRLFMKFIMPWAPFAVTPQVGAKRVLDLCLGTAAGGSNESGGYFIRGALAQPSPAAQDAAKAAECWRMSCEATGTALEAYGGLPVRQ